MIKKPRGLYDLIGEDILYFNYIENKIKKIAKLYDIEEIKLPMFENIDLYKRGTGETTDIVSKEIYSFNDKKDRSMALRPEGTAGVMRSYIENKTYGDFSKTTKYFYLGEFFRYERPQNGRQRQFNQFGVEYLNVNSIQSDVEIFNLVNDFLKSLNFKEIKFSLNNLGTNEERETYKANLVTYLNDYKANLCEDCLSRLTKNPLRILDCKIDGEKDFINNAPKISTYFGSQTKENYTKFLNILDELNISYQIDEKMVRGLDYYSGIIFEVEADGYTIMGGGAYNNLFNDLDGKGQCKAIGFGLGIERLILVLKKQGLKLSPSTSEVYLIDKVNSDQSFIVKNKLIKLLRENQISVETDLLNKSMKANFKFSNNFEGATISLTQANLENNTLTYFLDGKNVELSYVEFIERIKNV